MNLRIQRRLMTNIFICLLESTWDADKNNEKSKPFFLHRVLVVQKCQISLLVGSKIAQNENKD